MGAPDWLGTIIPPPLLSMGELPRHPRLSSAKARRVALLSDPHWEVMVDFDRADQQALVETIPPVAWETIKEFFVQELRRIGRMWFEPEG